MQIPLLFLRECGSCRRRVRGHTQIPRMLKAEWRFLPCAMTESESWDLSNQICCGEQLERSYLIQDTHQHSRIDAVVCQRSKRHKFLQVDVQGWSTITGNGSAVVNLAHGWNIKCSEHSHRDDSHTCTTIIYQYLIEQVYYLHVVK